jgi:uncharacterized protein YjbI with pentapeptide repeats
VTTEPEAAATTAVSQASPATERYSDFNELRSAHLDLRKSFPGLESGATVKLRQFLAIAQRTGTVLVDPSVRKAAQGILDYWCAELAGLSDATKEDFIPLTLAPAAISTLPDIEQTAGKGEETTQRKEDQRVLIRLSGMARQWRNSQKQSGYLLTGEALEQAHHFAQQDPDLLEFVEASEAAETARKKAIEDERRRKRNIAIAVGAAAGSVAVFLYWQFYTLPQTSRSWIRQIKETTSSETQTTNLWWLATFQPWTPPYDFSGTPKLANIPYPGLRLYAPNFSRTELSRVRLQKAQLPSASFNQSLIHIEDDTAAKAADGNGFKWNDIGSWFRATPVDWRMVRWNEFSGAELKLSQFREAQIFTTSFAGADLYRAVFDRAVLCDVNFSNADLLSASFWGATIDERTYGWLRKTAWWVAVGWNSGDFQKLLRPQGQEQSDPQRPSIYPPTDPADARALRHALRTSERFHTDVEIPIAETRPGTFDRASALNEMAWTLTTWGIDQEDLTPNPPPCNASTQPKDALDAASQSICIIEDLKRKGGPDRDYDYWLANFRDTQAYILMQVNRMPEARALYEKDLARTEADPGMLFRYAIALYATNEPNAAQPKFETAIREKQYLPSTELQNLKQYIPIKVLRMAYDAMDAAYPAPKLSQICPANPN